MWFEVLKVNLSIVPLSFLSPLVVSEDGPSDAIAFNRMISRERSQEKKKKKNYPGTIQLAGWRFES